jgi:phage baseplate assembly protein V
MDFVLKMLKNLFRVGFVSAISYQAGTVSVTFPDKDGIVSDYIPYLSFEYEMPAIGDQVLCLFLGNGLAKGFCLGRFFYAGNKPVTPGQGVYYKVFAQDTNAFLKYDKNSQTLTLTAANMIFNGNLTVNGSTSINGNTAITGNTNIKGELTATGDVKAGNISLDNHKHGGVSSGSGTTGGPQ